MPVFVAVVVRTTTCSLDTKHPCLYHQALTVFGGVLRGADYCLCIAVDALDALNCFRHLISPSLHPVSSVLGDLFRGAGCCVCTEIDAVDARAAGTQCLIPCLSRVQVVGPSC